MGRRPVKEEQRRVSIVRVYLFVLLSVAIVSHSGGAFTIIQAYPTNRVIRTDHSRNPLKIMTRRMSSNTPDVPTSDEKSLTKAEDVSPVKRKTWNPFRLAILRLGFTEPAMTSPLNYGKYDGTFRCAYCNHTLFDSNAKFNSGTGWPSFWRTYDADAVALRREWDGRLECRCANCQSHLGHVFLDGPLPREVDSAVLRTAPDTDPRSSYLPRFCINDGALTYQPRRSNRRKDIYEHTL
jgi:peptide-methionine (R)-S-oxide reductase